MTISRAVERLRSRLQERYGLTFQMEVEAETIGLDLSENCERDQTDLAAALRCGLAERSERWTDRFLERPQGRLRRYIICRHPLTLPETLVSPRFYDQRHEEVLLTEEEAAPLLSKIDPPISRPEPATPTKPAKLRRQSEEDNVPDQPLGLWHGRPLVRRAGAVSVL